MELRKGTVRRIWLDRHLGLDVANMRNSVSYSSVVTSGAGTVRILEIDKGRRLHVIGRAEGVAAIEVTATDVWGNSVSDTFQVTVVP